MAKVTLGKKPETITHTVNAKMIDGTDAELKMVYRYRTRKQFAALEDETEAIRREAMESATKMEADFAAAAQAGQEPAHLTNAAIADRAMAIQVELVRKVATGWNVDGKPFDEKNIEAFLDRYPGAGAAILTEYRACILEGRLGN
jgi:hypothetical protein